MFHSMNNMHPRPRGDPSPRPRIKFTYIYCLLILNHLTTSTLLMDHFFVDGLLFHNVYFLSAECKYLHFAVCYDWQPAKVHNIRERGEYLTLHWLCKTHCVKLLHNTHHHLMVLNCLTYMHASIK